MGAALRSVAHRGDCAAARPHTGHRSSAGTVQSLLDVIDRCRAHVMRETSVKDLRLEEVAYVETS